MDDEEWLSIPGHDLLEASSWGRVRSLPYESPMPHGGFKINRLSETYGQLARAPSGRPSRMLVVFRRKTYKVHRLVALAFLGEPQAGHEVLHIDENPTNNRKENLKWGTRKENLSAPGFIAYCKSRTGENSPTAKSRRL